MKFRALMGAVTAMAMVATPVMASAAPAANPAAKLSLSPSVRTGATSAKSSKLGGGGAAIVGLVVLAGIVALVVIAATQKDNGPAAKSP